VGSGLVGFADDSTNRSQNLLVPIHLQGFHAGTGLQDFKLRSVLDIPIAIGHVSVIVIWSAQEQRSRMFGLDVTNLPKPTIERGFL
jgi:hypothetical protein